MKIKTPNLWLRNTSRYPSPEAFICCRVARESVERSLMAGEKLPPIIVKLTNSSHAYCGRASWTEREPVKHPTPGMWTSKVWQRILVRVGPPERFPRHVCYPRFKDMPEYEFRTYREALIGVAAHEMGHVLGHSGRRSGEEMCEMILQDAVDYYRKHQAEFDAEMEQALAGHKARLTAQEAAQAARKNPTMVRERKLAEALAKVNQWQRRERAAHNKVKFYNRRVKYYRKLLEPAPLALAALNNTVDNASSVSDNP